MTALTVVGGSIAALVAADAAARAGRRVDLLLPQRGLGGGFCPIVRDGRRLDMGVRLLELDREDAGTPPPLDAYRPGPDAHAPFIRTVRDWAGALLNGSLREVDRPQMLVDGRMVDDIYFTVDLDGLASAAPAHAARIAREAGRARECVGDAGVLADPGSLSVMSLERASRTNHGEAFHARFIGPMCAKIHPAGAAGVSADRRRKIWMPLFHPRTLERAAGGRPTGFAPRRPFHTVDGGGMGRAVDVLMGRLRAHGARTHTVPLLVRVERGSGGATRMTFADGRVVDAVRPVLGTGAQELFAAAGGAFTPSRIRMAVAWVEVPDSRMSASPSVLHIPDPAVPAFRLSTGRGGRPGHTLVTVELACDVPEADMDASALYAVARSGVAPEGAGEVVHRVAGPAFVDPSPASVAEFDRARAALDRLGLEAEVVGGAAAFGADSFNEQVVQGLRAQEATA